MNTEKKLGLSFSFEKECEEVQKNIVKTDRSKEELKNIFSDIEMITSFCSNVGNLFQRRAKNEE